MEKRVVVAGINARNIARSAKIAGFKVYSVAKYLDRDLKLYSDRAERGDVEKVVEFCETYNAPAVISTGFEYEANKLKKRVELIGNYDYSCIDKLKFYRRMEKAGINCPEILKSCEGKRVILKPRFGGGGVNVTTNNRIDKIDKTKEYIVQEYVEGITSSATILCDGKNCLSTLNILLSGWSEVNADGFLYSGNITPFSKFYAEKLFSIKVNDELLKKAVKIAEDVAFLFEVEGCAGIDLIISDDVYVLELNPRIPGSLDSFEICTGESLFKLHCKAFFSKIDSKLKFRTQGLRAIYYSPEKVKAYIPLCNPFFADIPERGEFFEFKQPITSILASGRVLDKFKLRKKVLEKKFLEVVRCLKERKQ